MNRRDWIKAAGLAGSALALPSIAGAGDASHSELQTAVTRLKLRHTWTTTMSSSEFRDTLYVRFTHGGITGVGEGAPIVRYHEMAESARQAVESVRPLLLSYPPWHFEKVIAEIFRKINGQFAAKAAVDVALMDWVGKNLRVPLYRYYGLNPEDAPESS
jgi:L-alanine-DL-glutamate epimerase-like enolase superfamily enzyme